MATRGAHLSVAARSIPLLTRGSVSRDAIASLAYSAVVRVATLAISVAVARLVGSAGAGALGIALQVTALGSLIASFSLPQGVAKHLAESTDPVRRRALLRVSGLLVLANSLVVVFSLLGLSSRLAANVYHDASLASVLAWCGPLVLATTAVLWVEGALQGIRRFGTLARWGAVLSILDLIAGIGAAFGGVVTVLVARSLVRAGMVAVAVVRWLAPGRPAPAAARPDSRPIARTLLSFAGPVVLSSGIVLVGQTLLRLLLVRRAGLDDAGQFQAADGLAQGLLLVPTAASIAFMRAVSSDRDSGFAGLPASMHRALRQVTAWNLPLALIVIGVLPWVVVLLFGAGFQPARRVLVMLAMAYAMVGPSAIYGAVLLGRGEVWKAFAINLTWVVVALVAFQFGTGAHGALGAAAAVAIAYLLLLILCLAAFTRAWGVPARSVLPPALANIGAAAAGGLLALTTAVPGWVTAPICIGLAVAVFVRWGLPSLAPARAGSAA